MKARTCVLFLVMGFFVVNSGLAQPDAVKKIAIEGNKAVSSSTILSKIKTRVNQMYNENLINEDIKNLYATGFFENIEVKKAASADGYIVTFVVTEKPIIKEIAIKGARRIHKKRIGKLIDVEEGSFVDEYALKEVEDKIEDLYHQKGFSNATAESVVELDEGNQAIVTFEIQEKSIVRVKKIIIKGNQEFTDKRIKKLMRTKEKWWWFKSGLYKAETLEDDIKRIEDFYKSKGFSEMRLAYTSDFINNEIYITIEIEEGIRYYVGRVKVEGNQAIAADEINKVITIKPDDVYVEKNITLEINRIRGVYIDEGYIFAQVKPIIFFNPQTEKIDISFSIVENEVAYVEMIDIRGNVKTKDKVIRRELRVFPGDKFEGEKIRKSRQRLENLGFFEEVRFDSEPGSKPNWENLLVEVKEAKTGYISFGGGYSSIDEFTGFIEIRQRNFDFANWQTFTGAGQDLSLMASIGSLTERYELHFLNPWIFERPISFAFEGYKRGHDREDDVGYAFDEDVVGGAVRLGREFNDELRGWAGYRLESVEISDVAADASSDLKAEAGKNVLSSLVFDLQYDKRDNVFSPTKGYYLANSAIFTGGFLGGDRDFWKFISRASFYTPLVNQSVLEFRLRIGVSEPFSRTDKIPIFKRFFAGGASTIRGYQERKVGPIDDASQDPIGGEALFVGNIEYTYPLADILKVAVFFDAGNVWEKRSDFMQGDIKKSIGAGVRVKTPLGPVKLDYGWPLDLEPGEEKKEGRFHFSISRGF